MQGFRWELADRRDGPQAALFADEVERHVGRGEYRGLEFIHVRARSIINHVPSAAGLPFENTINPYRGCSHACKYCFARPTHEYLGLDAGLDFERRIVVKVNAVELARAETSPSRWSGASVALGTNTDPYQRAEGKYRLTRGILEVLVDRRNPFSILTKKHTRAARPGPDRGGSPGLRRVRRLLHWHSRREAMAQHGAGDAASTAPGGGSRQDCRSRDTSRRPDRAGHPWVVGRPGRPRKGRGGLCRGGSLVDRHDPASPPPGGERAVPGMDFERPPRTRSAIPIALSRRVCTSLRTATPC